MSTTSHKIQEIHHATLTGLEEIKAWAMDALKADPCSFPDTPLKSDTANVRLRIRRRLVLEKLIDAATCLAVDLIGQLYRVATHGEPRAVMGSDLPQRLREAEIRLELLQEMSYQVNHEDEHQ